MVIYFLYGLSFGFLGQAAYIQYRQGGDFPLKKQLPWLIAFGFMYGSIAWIEMFIMGGVDGKTEETLKLLRILLQPLSGLLLLIFGWGTLTKLTPLPSWALFIPGILVVPIAFVITYALTTFITPSPIEIPIDIWSRYLLYLPGSFMAGIGFLRQWRIQRDIGFHDVSKLMLGAGLAFLFEAFVVGLIVPAAPYGPASYYNYDRVVHNAFTGEQAVLARPYGLSTWLDYERVLETTGLPIQFWRMVSAIAVTFYIVRGLDVFDTIRKRRLRELQKERDLAQTKILQAQTTARQEAESWTEALININRRIVELDDADNILLYIVEHARKLLNSDFMAVALFSGEGSQLELKWFSAHGNSSVVDRVIEIRNPLILNALCGARSYRSEVPEPKENLENICLFETPGLCTVAIVSLNLDNHSIGALWGVRFNHLIYSETDLIWFEYMADQIVLTIKHGLMTAQLQSLSVIEERSRIAREMHDGIAQILGYLNLQVQTLEALHKQGKQEMLAVELAQMRNAVQAAHADVRENILSLRTTLAGGLGLVNAIEEYLEEFDIQTGIQVQFINETEDDLELSSIVEVQLVCILQEMLTNVRKHAQVDRVVVHLERKGENEEKFVSIETIDNGIGFQTSASRLHFGLQTMQERARSVGGTLVIQSTPGEGTRVICRLPCLKQEGLKKQSMALYPNNGVRRSLEETTR